MIGIIRYINKKKEGKQKMNMIDRNRKEEQKRLDDIRRTLERMSRTTTRRKDRPTPTKIDLTPYGSDYDAVEDALKAAGLVFHHSALARGYQTVKHADAEPYAGRFGTGYKVYYCNGRSNRYKIVEYWVDLHYPVNY